jgi:uncharacterized protein YggE
VALRRSTIVIGAVLSLALLSGCGRHAAETSDVDVGTVSSSTDGRDAAVTDPTQAAVLSLSVDEAEQLADEAEQDLASDG